MVEHSSSTILDPRSSIGIHQGCRINGELWRVFNTEMYAKDIHHHDLTVIDVEKFGSDYKLNNEIEKAYCYFSEIDEDYPLEGNLIFELRRGLALRPNEL